MINKVKKCLTAKRCKSRLNNKGFSLIEIMVALGLLTLLVGLAIPQYTSYRKRVKSGVVKSMLLIPYRTMDIEESLDSGTIAGMTKERLFDAIKKSDAKDEFTPDYNKDSTNKKWCFAITDKNSNTADDYYNYSGCIDNGGDPKVGGEDVACNQAKATAIDKDPQSGAGHVDCTATQCPSGCVMNGTFTATCSASDTAGEVKETLKCKPGTSETFSANATCSSAGVCSR